MSRSRTGLGFGVLLAVVMAGGQGLAAHGASSRAPSASATARAVAPAVTAVVTRLSDFDRDGFTDLVASQLGGALVALPRQRRRRFQGPAPDGCRVAQLVGDRHPG